MRVTNRKEYTLKDAYLLLKEKQTAHHAKKTRIKIDMDIVFESGLPGAKSFLQEFYLTMNALTQHKSKLEGHTIKNAQIIDNTIVQTALEDNPRKKKD